MRPTVKLSSVLGTTVTFTFDSGFCAAAYGQHTAAFVFVRTTPPPRTSVGRSKSLDSILGNSAQQLRHRWEPAALSSPLSATASADRSRDSPAGTPGVGPVVSALAMAHWTGTSCTRSRGATSTRSERKLQWPLRPSRNRGEGPELRVVIVAAAHAFAAAPETVEGGGRGQRWLMTYRARRRCRTSVIGREHVRSDVGDDGGSSTARAARLLLEPALQARRKKSGAVAVSVQVTRSRLRLGKGCWLGGLSAQPQPWMRACGRDQPPRGWLEDPGRRHAAELRCAVRIPATTLQTNCTGQMQPPLLQVTRALSSPRGQQSLGRQPHGGSRRAALARVVVAVAVVL